MKELRRSSLIVLRKSALTCHKAELAGFVFSSIWVFFNECHDSQDSRERVRLSLYILSTISTCLTDTETLARLLLQKAHLCAPLAPGLEPGNFDFLSQVTKQ